VELTPVSTPPARRRRPLAYVVLALVVVALGIVVYQALSSASLYFYNADEAIAKQEELGDKRFRLQGTVLGDSIDVDESRDTVDFTVAYNGARVDVHHDGSPPELFEAGIPVVLEGRWRDGVFASDRMLVKHSEVYVADNPDRVKGYDEGTATTVGPATP